MAHADTSHSKIAVRRRTGTLDQTSRHTLRVESLDKREMFSVTWQSSYPSVTTNPWSSSSLVFTPATSTTRSALTITPYAQASKSRLVFTPYTPMTSSTAQGFNGNVFNTAYGPRTSPPKRVLTESPFAGIFTAPKSGPTSVPPLASSNPSTSTWSGSNSWNSSSSNSTWSSSNSWNSNSSNSTWSGYTAPTYPSTSGSFSGSVWSGLDQDFFNWSSPSSATSSSSRIRTGGVDYSSGSFDTGSSSATLGSSPYKAGHYYKQNGVDFYYAGTNANGTPRIEGAWIQPNGSRFRVTETDIIQTHGPGGKRLR